CRFATDREQATLPRPSARSRRMAQLGLLILAGGRGSWLAYDRLHSSRETCLSGAYRKTASTGFAAASRQIARKQRSHAFGQNPKQVGVVEMRKAHSPWQLIRFFPFCTALPGEATRHATNDHAEHVPKWDYSFSVG
ncbi:hypothetical protein ACIQAL_23025, partial [Pseudomonas sp. NPDC088368]|uniref:hypothetical protein n=1 Tax=Pseudomonas sp. NPDC088368 TaxID=3364453 RepID=UPI00381CC353